MNQKELYKRYLEFSVKTDKLPDKYKKFKKMVVDICYVLGFRKPSKDDLALFEKQLVKWEKDYEFYQGLKVIRIK